MPVGEQIRLVRQFRRLQEQELAERAGISTNTLSQIESGARREGRPSTLQKIAAVLDVSVDCLMKATPPDKLRETLARESLSIYLQRIEASTETQAGLLEISRLPTAPNSVEGWEALAANCSHLSMFEERKG